MIAEALSAVRITRGGEAANLDLVRKMVSRGAQELVTTVLGEWATVPETDLSDFRRIYGGLTPRSDSLYPGAESMLRQLVDSGVRLGICTNKPQALTERILSLLGLSDCFAAVVGGDGCTRRKPHPDHVFETLVRMNNAVSEAVYVGDSEVDAEAAAAAGVPFLLVTFGYAIGSLDEIQRAATINHFEDMAAVMQGLPAPRV